MLTISPMCPSSPRFQLLVTLALLAVGSIPWPEHWSGWRRVIESARAPVVNRTDRGQEATGYYEGLIGGGDRTEGPHGELTLRLMGKPNGWVRFNDAHVARHVTDDFIQFELLPGIHRRLFGQPFITNSLGMHSPEVAIEKPPGTFRIALLGASMDMGWGVSRLDTYSHLLENWLNAHASRQGLATNRRFEVLNFAVAAYSPLQRLEAFRRKALPLQPDLVIFSATTLDIRLMEIHLCDIFRGGADLTYGFLREKISSAGIGPDLLAVDPTGKLIYKDEIKRRLQPLYWEIYDAALGELAGICRSNAIPLAMVIIPRVGKADAPTARAESVARLKALAARHALPIFDLSDTFDRFDPAKLEIAAWDDHPNTLGHRRLFLALVRSLVRERGTYTLLFPEAEGIHHDSPVGETLPVTPPGETLPVTPLGAAKAESKPRIEPRSPD